MEIDTIEQYQTDHYTIFNLYHGIGQAVAIQSKTTGRMVIVDAGGPIVFKPPSEKIRSHLKKDQIPYADWAGRRWQQIDAFLITHCHLDHYAALAGLYQATALATHWRPKVVADSIAQFYITKQFEETGLPKPEFLRAETIGKSALLFGPANAALQVYCLPTVHSTWQTVSYVIVVGQEVIIVMGDWKWASGERSTETEHVMRKFVSLAGKLRVSALVTPVVNCHRPGRAPSEDIVKQSLKEILPTCRGRVFFTCLARNFERILNFVELAHADDRYVTFAGQAMRETQELLVKLGLTDDIKAEAEVFQSLPPWEQAMVMTGHQASEWSGLWQLAHDWEDRSLGKHDTVIISSDPIYGHEEAWASLIVQIARSRARIYLTTAALDLFVRIAERRGINQHFSNLVPCSGIHAAGHAQEEDLLELIELLNPQDHLVLTHWPANKRLEVLAFMIKLAERAKKLRRRVFLPSDLRLVRL